MKKGRDVPMAESPPLKLSIDMATYTVAAQMDLEAIETTTDICQWLVANAGVTMDELRALTVYELQQVIAYVMDEIKRQTTPSKRNGVPSS